jgi:inorganic triphosphatase YgiF
MESIAIRCKGFGIGRQEWFSVKPMMEFELKLLVDDAAAGLIWKSAMAAGLVPSEPASRKVVSIYHDTADHALHGAGISLRLRRDGNKWVQTVKSGRSMELGISRVSEFETGMKEPRIDLEACADEKLRSAITALTRNGDFTPVCSTDIDRTEAEVRTQGGTRALLVVDRGRVIAGEQASGICEMEIELVDGPTDGIFEIARKVLPQGGARFSRMSKAARGYLLANTGSIELPPEPRKAQTINLKKKAGVADSAGQVLGECAEQVFANVDAVIASGEPEGPHQLRIGLRRLRCALSLFRAVIDDSQRRRLASEAGWMGKQISRLRDLDVIAMEIGQIVRAAAPGQPDFASLLETVLQEADHERRRVRDFLAGPQSLGFMLDLAELVESFANKTGPAKTLDGEQTGLLSVARREMQRRWKKAREKARRLDELTIEERHELRKELKKLRYAAEFVSPLYRRKEVTPFVGHLKSLQDVFGALADAAMVSHHLTSLPFMEIRHPGQERAIGWLLGAKAARAAEAWTHARRDWQELRGTSRFWR